MVGRDVTAPGGAPNSPSRGEGNCNPWTPIATGTCLCVLQPRREGFRREEAERVNDRGEGVRIAGLRRPKPGPKIEGKGSKKRLQ